MILSVTLNPAIDHIVFVDGLKPHDTNRVKVMQTDAGGKGINLSRIAVELGAKSLATGFLGGGPGGFVRHVLDREGVPHQFIETAGETRTNMNVESGDGPPTTFNAKGPMIQPEEWLAFLALYADLCVEADWVACGGSLPPGVPTDAFRSLGQIARANQAKFLVDADGEPMVLGMESGPDLIKPNRKEAERLLGHPLDGEDALRKACEELNEKQKGAGSTKPITIISLGKEGAVMFAEGEFSVGSSPVVEAQSTIGSGDSLLGGFLAGLQGGKSYEESLRQGLASGAATAMTDGTHIGQHDMIHKLLAQASVERLGAKG
jgi:1-phosphofructokinase family hexose kinase